MIRLFRRKPAPRAVLTVVLPPLEQPKPPRKPSCWVSFCETACRPVVGAQLFGTRPYTPVGVAS